ncbi:2-hydroxyacid dehydrogenase [Streptosporangium sp. NPDC051023]|uniref:2-hydroxyacid dehydrogenase n=1 Tax=Streptosporangium sp. NPDC051023 TaxID=3155410 RepID=UPI00344C4C93
MHGRQGVATARLDGLPPIRYICYQHPFPLPIRPTKRYYKDGGNVMSQKVLVTGTSVRPELLQPLRDRGWSVDNPPHLLSEGELKKALSEADAYLLGGDERAGRDAIAGASNLKIIAFLGMGYEAYVDSAAALEHGVVVTNTPGTLSNAVAELTIGHLLSGVRKIHYYAHLYETGQSGSEEKQRDIAALHHGIVGMGGIGTRVAEILRRGFDARVSYYSRTRKPELEESIGIEYLPLDELTGVVDTLIVLTPGNEETPGLIGERQLAGARPGLVLVNTARPEIVDADALNDALDSGRVSYAAFDDFYKADGASRQELASKIPSRLLVTGHIGSLTHDARDAMGILAVKSIVSMLETGTPLHRVV